MSQTQGARTPIGETNHEESTNAGKAQIAESQERIREVLDKLRRGAPDLKEIDNALAQRIEALVREGADQLCFNQRSFQHEVAYTFQDMERKTATISLTPEARAEVIRLAGSAPGLENARMLNLMHSTSIIEDRALVRDVRRTGAEIGQQADQNSRDTLSRIEVLENRVRLAQRPREATPEHPNRDPAEGKPTASAEPDNNRSYADDTPATRTARRSDGAARVQTQTQQNPQIVQGFVKTGKLDAILSVLRGSGQNAGAPWNPAPTPLAERLKSFQEAQRSRHDEATLERSETAGRAALNTLEGFRTGEGATILNRIQSAGRSEPGGVAEVLAEMRPGGRFSELRQQFNNALIKEKDFAQAFDQAAGALAEYAVSRPDVEQIIAHRPDAANLTAKFQRLDAEIGEAAGNIPSRRDSKNMLDDLAKQTTEMIQRAVEALKSLFGGSSPEAGGRTAAGPSMSP
ncbi:MAG: hypothetical protein ACREFP_24125 [Acetobacteraceae bacterium]